MECFCTVFKTYANTLEISFDIPGLCNRSHFTFIISNVLSTCISRERIANKFQLNKQLNVIFMLLINFEIISCFSWETNEWYWIKSMTGITRQCRTCRAGRVRARGACLGGQGLRGTRRINVVVVVDDEEEEVIFTFGDGIWKLTSVLTVALNLINVNDF